MGARHQGCAYYGQLAGTPALRVRRIGAIPGIIVPALMKVLKPSIVPASAQDNDLVIEMPVFWERTVIVEAWYVSL